MTAAQPHCRCYQILVPAVVVVVVTRNVSPPHFFLRPLGTLQFVVEDDVPPTLRLRTVETAYDELRHVN